MPDRHELFAQPHGNPPWCFCQDRDCPGWIAYVTWYQGDTGQAGEPDDDVIETHRRITKLIAELVGRYGELFGPGVDINTAVDLAALDLTGGFAGAAAQAGAASGSRAARQSQPPG
jgi:hypothetical protein